MQYFNINLPSQTKELAKKLFEDFLTLQDLKPMLTLEQKTIAQVFYLGGKYFFKNIEKRYKKILIFLANYHKTLNMYALKCKNNFTNDMALHFVILLGHSRIKDNKVQEAKHVLKNVWAYVDITSCCKILLSVALSNLCFLYIKKNRHFKALQCSLKCIQMMGQHLHELKMQNNKNQTIQDSVILVNSLIQCRRILRNIISFNNKSFYSQLYQYINSIGYKCSRKYLGQASQFTKVFQKNQDLGQLPIYLQPLVGRTSLQEKIILQLEGIYEVLKTKRQPYYIYVSQPAVAQPKKKSLQQQEPIISNQPSLLIIQPQPIVQQKQSNQKFEYDKIQMRTGLSVTTQINGWRVQAHILRPKNMNQSVKQNEIFSLFALGNLVLSYEKYQKLFKQIISTQKVQKILALIDFYSGTSFQLSLKRVNQHQFLSFFIFPYIKIDDEGSLEFITRKKSLIVPFQGQFLSEKSFIFINHIRGNNLRLTIAPTNSPITIHLNLQLRPLSIQKFLQIKEITPQFICQIYNKLSQLNYQKQIQLPPLQKNQYTQIKVKSQQKLKNFIISILNDFQLFICQAEQQEIKQINLNEWLGNYQEYLSQKIVFAFVEEKQNLKNINDAKDNQLIQNQNKKARGRFYFTKYLDNINSVDVFCQNNFHTYTMESQSKVKGTMTLYGQKFQKQFGVSLKSLQKQNMMQTALQMSIKRYELKLFFQPLRTRDEQLFNQNAILQLPMLSKSHKRSVIKDENGYMVPVTISHLAINNQIPLAFRIDVYFPFQGGQSSLLIKVQPILWQKPSHPQTTKKTDQNKNSQANQDSERKQDLRMCMQNYSFKKDYFLIEWFQIQGYDLILKNISIKDMKIYLRGSCLKFFSLQRLIQYIT